MRSRRREIVRELARILVSGGLLYFTVNVHHPVYAVAARRAFELESGGRAV